ncbi:TonB family protein [Pontibacter sp. KCTC 32443]|uniref:TonB family protein n=1 Tax=Pontibacter TaxID=323449 RepID=UPI00164DB94E|nr:MULTISPECIES: TonB family protein [Pontibacter]MBC5774760.1 TonB family protein [Pontibacter sp. KCTC 32443]
MNHANYPIHFGADGHPTLELLRQSQEGLLSPALSHQLERHLLDCELCADIAEGMTLSDATQTNAAIADIKQRMAAKEEKRTAAFWFSDWRAVAAVFVLMCSVVMVVYYQYTNLKTTSETIAVEKTETKQPETIVKFSPPAPIVHEETIEEAQTIVKPKLNAAKPVIAADSYAYAETEDEVFLDVETLTEIADAEITESVALEELTLDLKKDSVASIATAKTKARIAAAAPQMSFERALEGRVAGVALQRKSGTSNVVQGKVTDATGNPLPGVMVQVKGTMQGVSTDADGNFSIQMPEGKNVLSFRYIGYETKEQPIDSATNLLAINLQPDNRQLSEVVVTGYSKPTAAPIIEKPKPTIGTRAYKLYIKNEQRILPVSVKGRVIVGFTVSEKGQLENVRVLRSLNPEADAEAMRLIQQGPAWEPAMQNENPMAQQVKVVVRFR